jgi:periplasmic protein CpxP/Spy
MLPSIRSPIMFTPFARTVAVAALMGTTFLVSPVISAHANPLQLAQNAPAKTVAATEPTETKGETVEQRITNLHAMLKITPDEDSKWNSVAQAMRENAANMDKLVAAKQTQSPQSMTAVDDLKTYQDFAQAHVDGLKNLTSAFSSLYGVMPDAQKKNADQVFQNFGRNAPAHS